MSVLRIAKFAVLTTLLLVSQFSLGQEFSTAKGDNARTGKRYDPTPSATPLNYFYGGLGKLQWFQPDSTTGRRLNVIVDDNGYQKYTGIDATNASATLFTSGWTLPALGEQASFSFSLPTPAVSSSYRYTGVVPASLGNNTTTPVMANRQTFTWILQPNESTPGFYQAYVWLPQGPTVLGAGSKFPTRYYVYKIESASGAEYLDIVDTTLGGGGWVRLGGGGGSTNRLFQYDGSNPIKITLYNIAPRDAVGNLMDSDLNRVVYADAAMLVSDQGSYNAAPIVAQLPSGNTRVFAPLTSRTQGLVNGVTETIEGGILSSYAYASGAKIWSYVNAGSDAGAVLDNQSVNVVVQFPFVSDNLNPLQYAYDYFSTSITNDLSSSASVLYQPSLQDGEYDVYVYLPGDGGGENYGTAVQYVISEGATNTTVTVDQSVNRGWVRLGSRKFKHSNASGNSLQVAITNYSANTADAGKLSYADAVWFSGSNSGAFRSTPVYALAKITPAGGGTPVDTPVVVVATADGKLICLDAEGNGDGTTNVIWTYPSTRDTSNPSWTDPNQVTGLDGTNGIAEMPTGFDTSSALIQRVTVAGNPKDYLYIGSTNGRVYCIDMTGRGDYNFSTKKIGSTSRVWSFPDDYPSPAKTSVLGAFKGSVAFSNTASGPTLFVPTAQGRLYALDALGDPTTKITTTRWQYPAANVTPLGPITSTPSVEFGQVFVGSRRPTTGGLAKFVSLNADTGALIWSLNNSSNYLGGPATASSTVLGGGMPDTVFIADQGSLIEARRASDGTLLWSTTELPTYAAAPLTFTTMKVYQNTGIIGGTPDPLVMVPGVDGRLTGLFARTGSVNRFGTRRAWEYITDGPMVAGISQHALDSVGITYGLMYGGDTNGYLYCWGDASVGGGAGTPPGGGTGTENDTTWDGVFRQIRVRFIDKTTYDSLRAGTLTYAALDSAAAVPSGFEWGQTIYAVVYRYKGTDSSSPVPRPPIASFDISAGNRTLRRISVEGTKFASTDGTVPVDTTTGNRLDGFATFSMIVQGSGSNAIPPGNGKLSVTLAAALSSTGGQQNIAQDPANSTLNFSIANPLALVMTTIGTDSIGYTTNPTDAQVVVNGSPAIGGTDFTRLGRSFGLAGHGKTGATQIQVVDRSLMSLLLGPGRGLPNVRVQRRDLAWQGGAGAVYKPLPAFASALEQLPINLPNDSPDYPDIRRSTIRVTKDLFGTSENPLFSGVTLNAPTGVVAATPTSRTLVTTPFDFEVDVPKYQPANLSAWTDLNGNSLQGGYAGPMVVFVDSNGSGVFDENNESAYRTFNLLGQVEADERMSVRTPIVDLGTLAGGTAFAPISPLVDAAFTFSPWAGAFQTLFKEFVVVNEGNTNMLNLRLAKGLRDSAGNVKPFGFFGKANDPLSWLDATTHLWTDFDSRFYNAPSGLNSSVTSVVLPKARVGDRSGTQLKTNPKSRSTGQKLDATGPEPANPRVALSVPLGFPIGSYELVLKVVEDTVNSNGLIDLDSNGASTEFLTDPGFRLKFKVGETRLTNGKPSGGAPMLDDLISGTGVPNYSWRNLAPTAIRDRAGNLVMVYASDRLIDSPTVLPSAPSTEGTKLYIASIPGTPLSSASGFSPLRDLDWLQPFSATRWWKPQGTWLTASAATLFGTGATNESYRNPALPTNGMVNSLNGASLTTTTLAFVGDAVLPTTTGQNKVSKIMVSQLSIDPSTGAVTVSQPITNANDTSEKGRVSVVQVGSRAVIFYSEQINSQSSLAYVIFDGTTLSEPVRLNLGKEFDGAGSPSAIFRTIPASGINPGRFVYELSFAGKVKSAPSGEIFRVTIEADANGLPITNGDLNGGGPVVTELLTSTGAAGTFRTTGVSWEVSDPSTDVVLERVSKTGVATSLRATGSTVVYENGVISFDCALGGRIYADTVTGTVRFTNAPALRDADLRITYRPTIRRVSQSTGGFNGTSSAFDDNQIGDISGTILQNWFDSSNAQVGVTSVVRPGRWIVTYRRAANGPNQPARPFLTSLRLGIHLPQLKPGMSVSVAGMNSGSFYELDSLNGNVYFTAQEEQNPNIVITGIENGVAVWTIPARLSWITELAEAAIPMDQAINESAVSIALDPILPLPNEFRPSLLWLFWSSSRFGGPDVFMQGYSPKFSARSNN